MEILGVVALCALSFIFGIRFAMEAMCSYCGEVFKEGLEGQFCENHGQPFCHDCFGKDRCCNCGECITEHQKYKYFISCKVVGRSCGYKRNRA